MPMLALRLGVDGEAEKADQLRAVPITKVGDATEG
jgi:hypothetical protein